MSPFDRRLFTHFNWTLLGLALLLFALGVINLYSASSLRVETGMTTISYYKKQLLWGIIGLCGMLAAISFDYRHLKSVAWPFYFLTCASLIWVLFFGVSISGAQRWIDLWLINFQPSEFAKLSLLLLSAVFLASLPEKMGWKDLGKILVLSVVPTVLVIVQPDLGSGLNILMIVGGMILFKGIRKPVLLGISVIIPLVAPFSWYMLEDYQKSRILTFINPDRDPLGSGYNIIQSEIAIGSGQFWGKGFLEGTQSQLRFLPEKHTDFVFAVFGEEWGFAGCFLLLTLFCLFLHQILLVIRDSKDYFGSFLAVGVFFYFFWQIFINMSMVLGLMPVVGIPLPFLSYGGTSTVINFFLLGLVLNVSMRRYVFKHDG
jgi:rod shape determining protein RodA